MLTDHVHQLEDDEVVAAEVARQLVRQPEVDAVARIRTEVERLGVLHPIDIDIEPVEAALGVVPAVFVVDDLLLHHGDAVGDLSCARWTRVAQGSARLDPGEHFGGGCDGIKVVEATIVAWVADHLRFTQAELVDDLPGDDARGGRLDAVEVEAAVVADREVDKALGRVRRLPADLAGNPARVTRVLDRCDARLVGHRRHHRDTNAAEVLQRQVAADADAVGRRRQELRVTGGAGHVAEFFHVVRPEQGPEAVGEVGIEVAVEDRVAHRAGAAARAVGDVVGEHFARSERLGVDRRRVRQLVHVRVLGCRTARLQVWRPVQVPDVLDLLQPLVGVHVEDVRFLHTGHAEVDTRRLAGVGMDYV